MPLGMLTMFVVATTLAVASYFVLAKYTRKARVSGYLVPDRGVIRLMSPQVATLVESHAIEGATVRQGDVLFVLLAGQSTLSGDTQTAVRSGPGAARAKPARRGAKARRDGAEPARSTRPPDRRHAT